MNGLEKVLRWLGGAVAVVLVVLLAITLVASFVQISWTSESTSGLEGRTPATLAQGCDDIGGTLTVAEGSVGAHSTCMAKGGNSIRCDWAGERCMVDCDDAITVGDAIRLLSDRTSHPACNEVRSLAAEPFGPLAAGTPVLGELSGRADR